MWLALTVVGVHAFRAVAHTPVCGTSILSVFQ